MKFLCKRKYKIEFETNKDDIVIFELNQDVFYDLNVEDWDGEIIYSLDFGNDCIMDLYDYEGDFESIYIWDVFYTPEELREKKIDELLKGEQVT